MAEKQPNPDIDALKRDVLALRKDMEKQTELMQKDVSNLKWFIGWSAGGLIAVFGLIVALLALLADLI